MVLYTPLYEGPINTREKVARSVKKHFFLKIHILPQGRLRIFYYLEIFMVVVF